MRYWLIAGAGAAAAALLLLFLFLPHKAAVPAAENGTFANDCCGTLKLADGQMLLNDQQNVHYTVGRDAEGPYLRPSTYVGARTDEGFEVDGTRPTLKLRVDRLPRPNRILLSEGRLGYVFVRQPPRRVPPR